MLKLNVGLSRKVGEPNYGSRGASVHLELEVESALAGDSQTLRDRIRALFRLARASVDEELHGHGLRAAKNGNGSPNGHTANGNGHTNGHRNGYHGEPPIQGHDGASHSTSNGNGSCRPGGRLATISQVRAIHAIANRRKLNLEQELKSRFGHSFVDQLSLAQASQCIDDFKAMELAADY